MTGFEPWTSGIGSDRSTNWDTTTAPSHLFLWTIIIWLKKTRYGNSFYWVAPLQIFVPFDFSTMDTAKRVVPPIPFV